ncbi:ferritin family protein [bacterium]|nr:ferritin family protein [bacterium]
MANLLKVVDVVMIGIEKEKARRDFYERVARHFSDDAEMKDLFTKLRDWEAAHIRTFQAIADTVDETAMVESYPGELQAYMDALVEDKLYRDVDSGSFAGNIQSPVDALEYGIVFEKDAILLFMELTAMVQTEEKKAIEELIEEERQHVVQLTKMLRKYQ